MARRILIFSIGFFMGCVAVYAFLFKGTDRDFYGSWLPEGRVLKKINSNLDRQHATYACQLDESGIFPSEIDLLLEEGDVDFAASNTTGEIKTYQTKIELDNGRLIQVQFAIQSDSSWIQQLGVGSLREVNCD